MSLLRAILYELQPIRFSEYHLTPGAIASYMSTRVLPMVKHVGKLVVGVLLPKVWSSIRNSTPRQWMIVGAIFAYYIIVRWIHE